MTDGEIEALLRLADKWIACMEIPGTEKGSVVRQLATALRHSREELRAAREDGARLDWLDEMADQVQFNLVGTPSGDKAEVSIFFAGGSSQIAVGGDIRRAIDAARAARSASEEKS